MINSNYIEEIMIDLLKQKEAIILDQLNDLIKNNVLLIEEAQPVLVREVNQDKITLRGAVRLTFHGAEEMEKLRKENNELKERLEILKGLINGVQS